MHSKKILTSIIAEQYYDQIFGYCYIKLHNEADAYDCTQEVFAVFLEKYRKGKITYTEEIDRWLISAAKKIIKNYQRKSKHHEGVALDDAEIFLPAEKDSYNLGIPFEDILEPEEYKIIYERYVQKKDIKEMAKKAGISEQALYKRTERIVNKIRLAVSEKNPNEKR